MFGVQNPSSAAVARPRSSRYRAFAVLAAAGAVCFALLSLAEWAFGLSVAVYTDLAIAIVALLGLVGMPTVALGSSLHANPHSPSMRRAIDQHSLVRVEPRFVTLIATVAIIGFTASAIESSLIGALSSIQRSIHLSLFGLTWVVLGGLLGAAATAVASAFGIRPHRRSAYVVGGLLLAASSIGAATSAGGVLSVWCIPQGFAASLLVSNVFWLIHVQNLRSAQVIRAFGIVSFGGIVGLTFGASVGGLLAGPSWRWVFVFYGLGGLVIAILSARSFRGGALVDDPNLIAAGLFIVAVAGLTLGLSHGLLVGWDNPLTLAGLILAAVLMIPPAIAWLYYDARGLLLSNPAFVTATVASATTAFVRVPLMLVFLIYFRAIRDASMLGAGLLIVPYGGGYLVGQTASTRLYQRFGARVVSIAGIGLVELALIALSATFDATTPLVLAEAGLCLAGVGLGLFSAPNMLLAIADSRDDSSRFQSFRAVVHHVGALISVVLTFALISKGLAGSLPALIAAYDSLASAAAHATYVLNMGLMLRWLAGMIALGIVASVATRPRSVARAEVAADSAPVSATAQYADY